MNFTFKEPFESKVLTILSLINEFLITIDETIVETDQMKFEKIVDEIMFNKEKEIETLELELTLDKMVYELYNN